MNLEAVYGDGVRSAAAALTIDPLPVGPAKFSDLYGGLDIDCSAMPDRELVVDQDCLLDGPLLIRGRLRTKARFDRSGFPVTIDDPLGEARWVNEGHHVWVQPDPAVNARTYFCNIDETKYVGGDAGAHTDPGYIDHGPSAVREIRGAYRRRRTRAAGPLSAGQTSTVFADATGWQVGDRLIIQPSERQTVPNFHKHFDDVRVTSVNGNLVGHDPLTYPHPAMVWEPISLPGVSVPAMTVQPGVINVTSNVGVEGQAGHRAQVMAHHGIPAQTWSDFAHHHVGPRQVTARKADGSPSKTATVLGRYGEHLHHCGDSTRGHRIERGVVTETGTNGFWTHASHGVTLDECVVHDFLDTAFGWDVSDTPEADASNSYVERSPVASYRHNDPDGPDNSTIESHMFAHPLGGIVQPDGSVTERPVRSDPWGWSNWGTVNSAMFHWSSLLNHYPNNGWETSGYFGWGSSASIVFVWQNDNNLHHVIDLLIGAAKLIGVKDGAYAQPYRFTRPRVTATPVGFNYNANARRYSPDHVAGVAGPGYLGPCRIAEHGTPGSEPHVTRDTVVTSLVVAEALPPKDPGAYDFVNTGLTPAAVTVTRIHPDSVIRIQTAGQAWQVTGAGIVTIPLFDGV